MNYEHIDIDRMVMESHYLHALDIEDSQREGSLSDMERQDYIDIIKALREERVQLREMISSLQDTIKSLNQQLTRHEEIDAAKDKRIAELNEKIDKLTLALTSTTERLNIMLDEKYNKKSKSNRHDNNKPAKKSREQEKEEDDGTNINSGSGASGPTSEESLDKTKVSSENLDGKRGPRENVIPGTHCTAELMAEIILDNIKHALPLHRCNDKMVYDGFQVSENTRKNWMYKTLELLKPLNSHLKKELFEVTKILNIDETWCRVRIKYKGDNTKLGSLSKKYIWVVVNKITKVTYFLYDNDENDSRGLRPLQEFLGEFAGAIQSDGYVVYTQLTKKHPELIKHLECWAHVRTKFKNAFKVSNDPMADWFVKQIGRLYLVEAECFLKGLSAEETKYRRNRREVTRILESIKSKAEELLSRQRIHYSPSLRRALNYMKRGWENLIRYREDGDYSIDNSIAERAVRPYTVFRNGTMFHGSERGVENTTFFYSLIETGKARGLNVKNYLVSMIREMLHGNTDYKGILQGAYI